MENEYYRNEQENERFALKAIYGEDLLEIVPDSSLTNSWSPLECIITLRSSLSSEPLTADSPVVSLHVTCSSKYPDKVPSIKLQHWKKISNENIARLQNELERLAESLKGEVMIFQLAQHAVSFLYDCFEPSYESFYEEMMIRHKDKLERERQINEEKNEKKKQEVRAEIQVKEQAVKKALRRRQNSVKSLEDDYETPHHSPVQSENRHKNTMWVKPFLKDEEDRPSKKNEDYNPWTICEKGQSRFEHEFEHIKSLGKGAFGHVIKVRNKLDDGFYAIKKIILEPSDKKQQLNKKITREVKFLSRLNHENVVRYYNSWIESAGCSCSSTASSDDECKATAQKNLGEEVLDMLPHHEPSIDWISDGSSTPEGSQDDFVVMFRSRSSSEKTDVEDSVSSTRESKTEMNVVKNQCLIIYIQMELCDRSTLRLAIDDDLYTDVYRVWRLFREIVEGLCHIHQQGIIHRDLKPVNIFIGHDNHVKIGDFGLATTIRLQKQAVRESAVNMPCVEITNSLSSQQTDASQTGQVGTILYVAPELNNISIKTSYNQKVDIYSLGIIFFEMCSPPMATSMERFQVLTNMRQVVPIFPVGYHLEENSPQRILMRSMLQHDVEKRPSAQELLQNGAIPPPKREESEVSLMIKRTLSNPQSRNYKYLIASCFDQAVQPTLDATYNVSSWRSPLFTSALEVVSSKLRSIFQNHGASSFLPPLLTPAGHVVDSTVCLLTRFGSVVHATHDMQVPFARYLAQNPGVCHFKRYAIDKVYRERPAGVHPKENYECSFDLVTPAEGDLLPEYQIICVISEILQEFPSILSRNCVLYLNHSSIISVMLEIAGIDDLKFKNEKIAIFQKNGLFNSKTDFVIYLKSLGLPDRSITTLIQWLHIEGPLNKIIEQLRSLVKDKKYAPALESAFLELEAIYYFTQVIGIPCPVLVNLGQVRNAHYYSGVMMQIAFMQKNKPKQSERSVVLSGGRYDKLVQDYKEALSHDDTKVNQFVVGFTLSIDKLIYSLEDNEKSKEIDVLICPVGKLTASVDTLTFLQELWKSGLKTSFISSAEALEETLIKCKDLGIQIIVLLKEKDVGFARVRTLMKDRYYEKKVNYSELLDYIWKHKTSLIEASINSKSELKTQTSSDSPVISFVTLDKLTPASKRRHESQILNNIQSVLLKFSSKVKAEILALPVDAEVARALSQHVDPNTNLANVNPIIKKYAKFKKLLQKFQDYMDDAKNSTQTNVFIVYSLIDNTYNVIM